MLPKQWCVQVKDTTLVDSFIVQNRHNYQVDPVERNWKSVYNYYFYYPNYDKTTHSCSEPPDEEEYPEITWEQFLEFYNFLSIQIPLTTF